jgi:hypothetical protein
MTWMRSRVADGAPHNAKIKNYQVAKKITLCFLRLRERKAACAIIRR